MSINTNRSDRAMRNLSKALSGDPDSMAKRLLGCYLNRSLGNRKIVCKIVETEAYDQLDPASHSYRGMTPGTASCSAKLATSMSTSATESTTA